MLNLKQKTVHMNYLKYKTMNLDLKIMGKNILLILASIIFLGLLFQSCAKKSSCDAYSSGNYKYCIEGYVMHEGDSCAAIAFTDRFTSTNDSVFYYNSDSSIQTILPPYTVYEFKSK
jgi:hypothetical protein